MVISGGRNSNCRSLRRARPDYAAASVSLVAHSGLSRRGARCTGKATTPRHHKFELSVLTCIDCDDSVSFLPRQVELKFLMLAMRVLALMRHATGQPRDIMQFAPLFNRLSMLFYHMGTDDGAMGLVMEGTPAGHAASLTTQSRLRVRWSMYAGSGHGPQTPCVGATVLARQLALQAPDATMAAGARPCVSEFSLDDFERAVKG